MRNPNRFTRMPGKACGPNSAKWTVAWYGGEYQENDGLDYMPVLPGRMARLIVENGLKASLVRIVGRVSIAAGVTHLTEELKDGPILLFCLNRWMPHWVVLCSYSDEKRGFCAYDWSLEDDYDWHLPVGNRFFTEEELILKWHMPFWGTFFPSWRHLIVKVRR